MVFLPLFQDHGAGLIVSHLDVGHQVIHYLPGQIPERGVGKQVITDFNEFDFHGVSIRATLFLFKPKIKKLPVSFQWILW
jgi:hypothetical protein